MTPAERAEKIALMCGHQPNTGILAELIPAIAAQIEEAERAQQVKLNSIVHDFGFIDGWNAAKEKAKGIIGNLDSAVPIDSEDG